jgi:hypothetical protein
MARNPNIDDDTRERAMRFVRDREGQNPNIGDDTRERARKFVESGGKKDTPSPARKAAPKPKPKPMAKPAAKAAAPVPAGPAQGENSVPKVFSAEERAERAAQPTKRNFMNELGDNAGKALGAIGATAGTALGIKQLMKRAAARKAASGADDIMAAGNKRAADIRAGAGAEGIMAAGSKRATGNRAMKQVEAQDDAAIAARRAAEEAAERQSAAQATKRARAALLKPKDPEYGSPGFRMGGNVAKYAKGGSVKSRGDGCAARGKTKGRFV